jgi:hypothetical protein
LEFLSIGPDRLPAADIEPLIGQEYEILEVTDCSGKRARAPIRCKNGGPIECPGRVRLDRPPFADIAECYSWGAVCIFDFYLEGE